MTAGTPSGPAGPDARGTDRRFEDEAQAADLSARMFWSPTPARSTAGIAVCSALLAILILYRADVPLARQPALPLGYALLLSASFLTALLTQAISVRMGIMYPRRAFLLALIGLIVAMPGVLLGALLPWPWSTLSMVGLATPVWIRHVTLVGTSRPRHLANLPVTLLQTVLLAAFLQPVRPLSAMEILVLANSVLGFLVGAYLFLAMVSGPMRRVYGIAPYELLVHGLEHFTRRGGLGAEAFFHSISSRARVWYGHIRIRRRSGDPIDIVSTALHPGPFGLYGGSDLPAKLRRSTGWARLMAFHGPCGHDMNPSRTEDVDRLARALLRGSDRIRYSRTATPPASAERGGVWIRGQCIGDALLVVCSRAPLPTDDLDYPTGMMALAAAKRATGRRVGLFVDAHNSLERGTGSILFGDDASF
ncbi:MAG TPA: DUF2070 family protein, partial [Thermoplasmata archaeon]|nr:DUF2070 family protein [Thermoplasmata archaeon]